MFFPCLFLCSISAFKVEGPCISQHVPPSCDGEFWSHAGQDLSSLGRGPRSWPYSFATRIAPSLCFFCCSRLRIVLGDCLGPELFLSKPDRFNPSWLAVYDLLQWFDVLGRTMSIFVQQRSVFPLSDCVIVWDRRRSSCGDRGEGEGCGSQRNIREVRAAVVQNPGACRPRGLVCVYFL